MPSLPEKRWGCFSCREGPHSSNIIVITSSNFFPPSRRGIWWLRRQIPKNDFAPSRGATACFAAIHTCGCQPCSSLFPGIITWLIRSAAAVRACLFAAPNPRLTHAMNGQLICSFLVGRAHTCLHPGYRVCPPPYAQEGIGGCPPYQRGEGYCHVRQPQLFHQNN